MTRTLTTSKGHTFTTSFSDDAAHAIVRGLSSPFAQSLTSKPIARLSESQRVWLHKLAVDAQAPAPAPVEIEVDPAMLAAWEEYEMRHEWFDGDKEIADEHYAAFVRDWKAKHSGSDTLANVQAMLSAASSELKWPKIRLIEGSEEISGSRELVLKPRGNVVYIEDAHETRWDEYRGQHRPLYYGKIENGSIVAPRSGCPDWVVNAVRRFSANPLEEARKYGRLTGHCCFCSRKLTDPASVENGYGPVCAKRYGL